MRAEIADVAGYEDKPDPAVVRAALARFLSLPVTQRSAVILKDVLGHSLEEAAETMGTTVMAVKAALVRGRAKLLEARSASARPSRRARRAPELDRYAALFNARDWDGVRALVGDDCRLDLVSKSQRRGKRVGMYFGRYEKEDVSLRVVRLEGTAGARRLRRPRGHAGLLHPARVGGGPREVDPRLPLRPVHRRRRGVRALTRVSPFTGVVAAADQRSTS